MKAGLTLPILLESAVTMICLDSSPQEVVDDLFGTALD
jgi:hypothetical protein